MKLRAFITLACIAVFGLVATMVFPTSAQSNLQLNLSLTGSINGFSSPVHLTHAGDGSGRMFVVEQAGRIRIVRNGAIVPTPFLDINSLVSSPSSGGGSEEGLLSVAFPPGYANSRRFYVYYTNRDSNIVIARYRVTGSNADVADPNSAQVLFTIPHPGQRNHNGGQLAFGPDGFLYIGTGDGGGGGDPDGNGQDRSTLLGKMLRVDVEGNPTGPYTIPPSNPYVNTAGSVRCQPYDVANPPAGFCQEIWAWGLRNPWRFSFDRQTGDMYNGDVGQQRREEINFQPAGQGGLNYGWNTMEGRVCYPSGDTSCNQNGLTLPVIDYNRQQGTSVTGGYVYRGTRFPRMQGIYFYADFGNGNLWGFRMQNGQATSNTLLLPVGEPISSFGEDEAGNLYVVNYGGSIALLTDSTTAAPTATPPAGATATPRPGNQIRIFLPLVRR
ncbi:MAG: PQQ-dependent sugar dehydrogenase [Chloroflexaceae bacterium]|jgi:glucose/arabinose dehydrogenase|nr:PQQ-dependent sugar dehydrogenase [Chloroflexaceae bacterium]